MDKETAVYPCNGILRCNKKERNTYIYYYVDESWKHYAKLNKQDTQKKAT